MSNSRWNVKRVKNVEGKSKGGGVRWTTLIDRQKGRWIDQITNVVLCNKWFVLTTQEEKRECKFETEKKTQSLQGIEMKMYIQTSPNSIYYYSIKNDFQCINNVLIYSRCLILLVVGSRGGRSIGNWFVWQHCAVQKRWRTFCSLRGRHWWCSRVGCIWSVHKYHLLDLHD